MIHACNVKMSENGCVTYMYQSLIRNDVVETFVLSPLCKGGPKHVAFDATLKDVRSGPILKFSSWQANLYSRRRRKVRPMSDFVATL